MSHIISLRRREIAEVHLEEEHCCSKCGKVTHGASLLQVMAYRKFSLKKLFDVPPPLEKVAFDKLDRKLDLITDEGNADRYEAAGLRCGCSFCGHKEPWTGMHYDKVDFVIRLISTIGLLISGPFVIFFFLAQFPFASGTPKQFSLLTDLFVVAVVILGSTWLLRFCRRRYKRWHRRRIRREILQLPPESLPRVTFDPSEKTLSTRRGRFTDVFYIYFLAPDGIFKL